MLMQVRRLSVIRCIIVVTE